MTSLKEKRARQRRKKILIILLTLLVIIFSIFIAAVMVFKYYYGLMNFETEDDIYLDQTITDFEDEDWLIFEDIYDDEIYDSETSDIEPDSESIEPLPNPEDPDNIPNFENTEDTDTEPTSPDKPEEDSTSTENNVVAPPQEPSNDLEEIEVNKNNFRVMLLGVDSRQNNMRGRTDSMILFEINPDTKKVLMTSFLRDIYVTIPGVGENRLNAAYVFGGTKLLFKTMSEAFGIEVDKYVLINFGIVSDVIDAFGGIDIALTQKEIDHLNKNLPSANRLPQAVDGKVHLNGTQALAYSRIRKIDSDFARTNRQRKVIDICVEKVKNMSVSQLEDMLKKFLPRVTTNLTEKDVLTLFFMALNRNDYQIESMAIPVSGTWEYATIRGMAVLTIDFAANSKAWYEKVAEK